MDFGRSTKRGEDNVSAAPLLPNRFRRAAYMGGNTAGNNASLIAVASIIDLDFDLDVSLMSAY